MMLVLFAATMISPFPDYKWGGLLPYFVLAILLTINLRDLTLGDSLRSCLAVANLINVAVGIAVIAHVDLVGNILTNLYSAGYPELVPYMMSVGKPVLTFATHSIGAFFYYLFFFINFETYKVHKNWKSLVFAISYIGLTFAMLSVTGMVLTSLALFQLLRHSAKKRLMLTVGVVILASVSALFVLYLAVPNVEDWIAAGKFVSDILTSPVNGFFGRYGELGTMYSTLHYIRSRPFTPVGVGYRSDLMFGDSGPIEYLLRGSVVLLLVVYGGLFFFLRRNLLSRSYARLLFLVILGFEIGISSLNYFRTLYLLPVFVVYLNDLSRKNPEGQEPGSQGLLPSQ
jgi:hypothetical protein